MRFWGLGQPLGPGLVWAGGNQSLSEARDVTVFPHTPRLSVDGVWRIFRNLRGQGSSIQVRGLGIGAWRWRNQLKFRRGDLGSLP